MGNMKLWSFAAVALIAWIPYISGGPSSKNAIKLVKPPGKIAQAEKNPMTAASRRQQTAVSIEDDDNYSGPEHRPSFGPFPPRGFSQGPPLRYAINDAQDEAQDRFDVAEAPEGAEGGMGFMPEFGPPKGFPDLSKLTGGEFPKMASTSGSNYESSPQYSAQDSPKYNPFPLFPSQGGLQYYDESDDGPSPGSPVEGRYQASPAPTPSSPQNAPKRRPFRGGRPGYRGGNQPSSFSNHAHGPNSLGGPGPYGAPEGLGGPGGPYGSNDGPYGPGPSGLDGPSGRPFGSSRRPSQPFGTSSDGPSRPALFNGRPDNSGSRPAGLFGGGPGSSSRPGGLFGGGSDGPSSRPGGLFGSGPDGPSSRPEGLFGSGPDSPNLFGSDGPSSRPNPFIGSSDGPPSSRPGLFGGGSDGRLIQFGANSDGPPSRPNFGDGPSSRPGFGDGPSSRPGLFGPGPNFDGPSEFDGPPSRPSSIPNIDAAPSRPNSFMNVGGSPTRPIPFGGPSSRPGPYNGPEGGSGRPGGPGPYNGPEGNPGRPGNSPFGGPDSSGRPSGHSLFGGPDGGNVRHYGGPEGGSGRPGNSGPFGRHEGPPAYSFTSAGPNPGLRLSRGYPRYHPNQIQSDDFKESNDNGDFSPFGNGPQFNYPPPPPRHSSGYRPDDYEQSPYQSEGPRSRRPEYSLQSQQPGSLFGSTHRHDVKRPIVLKVSGLKNKYSRELPPGPPIFYAPSPDMKSTKDNSRKFQESEDKENNPVEASSRAKAYLVKSRPKRDLVERRVNSSSTETSASCKTGKERGCSSSARQGKKLPRRISNVQRASSGRHETKKIARRSRNNGTRSRLQDPMVADGTQQQGFWEVSPQPAAYGTYTNNYKKQRVPSLTAQERQDEYDLEDDDESIAPPSAPARAVKRKNQTFVDTTSDEQRFFPSFPAPPSPYLNPFTTTGGFGRPPLFPGPTANRAPSRFHPQFGPKYTAPPPNRGPSSAYPAESHDRYLHTNLLGSGNFEVVRGGTYYGDDGDDGYHHATSAGAGHYHQEDDDGYFHHNGHSSPHGYRNNPSGGGGDFFANFRDFADINPPTRSFSHHLETVADGTEPHGSATSHEQPKNILDKLESSSDKIEVHRAYTGSSSTNYGNRDSDPMMATF